MQGVKRVAGLAVLVASVGLQFAAPVAGDSSTAAPHWIAGFALGADIATYKDRIRQQTAMCTRYMEYLEEVEILPQPGFKSGLLAYGTCAEPGRIVRLKLKYADGRRKFYDRLLERFKQRFGEPDEWRGDPFGVLVAWKWSFTDAAGNRISMILQHNAKDPDQKLGNAVKLTCTTWLDQERVCFEARDPFGRGQDDPPRSTVQGTDWNHLLPR